MVHVHCVYTLDHLVTISCKAISSSLYAGADLKWAHFKSAPA